MYPTGLKKVIVSLVTKWEKLVLENNKEEECKRAKSIELLARLPRGGVRSLRELLGLVIASYDYTVFYQEMVWSAHQECGTREHPFWCSEEWEVDFVKLITEGVNMLSDKEILMLALHPTAVMIAHEIIGEEIMYDDRISKEWHVLVEQVYKERKREVLSAAAELGRALQGAGKTAVAEKCRVGQSGSKSVSRSSRQKQLLQMISGEYVELVEDDAVVASESGGGEKATRRKCRTCDLWFIPKEECWEHCEICAADGGHIEEMTDDVEDMSLWEDTGASLSDLSLEKMDVLKKLEPSEQIMTSG